MHVHVPPVFLIQQFGPPPSLRSYTGLDQGTLRRRRCLGMFPM